jgi:hypothetical protein
MNIINSMNYHLFITGLLLSFCLMISCSSKNDLTWNQEKGYQWAVLDPGNDSTVGFNKMPSSQTNITFENYLSEEDMKSNFHYLNGSGVAAGDVDGDGWTDLYFTQLDGPNRLYKNLGGFEFKNITKEAGVDHSGYYSTGAVFADVDGDDDLDLIVSAMHKQNVLYLNDGNGNFSLSQNSGLGEAKGSTTMALADIDGDSDLDLYIANYKETPANELFSPNQLALENIAVQKGDSFEVRSPFDQHYIVTEAEDGPVKLELGEQDNLFLNNGDGTFKSVENLRERFLGVGGHPKGFYPDWGLTVKFQDINSDGLPDIYVCNDVWTPDRVWINQGKGIFRAVDPTTIRNYSFSSMGVDFSDVNRDGHIDFFVSEMLSQNHEKRLRQFTPDDPYFEKVDQSDYQPQYNRNSLYMNRGDETFAETSYFSGLEASGWSWATHFLDVDLDGYEDLFINTGFTFDVQDMDAIVQLFQSGRQAQGLSDNIDSQPYPRLELSNKIFKNNQDLTFTDKSSEWGLNGDDISHGLASADLDRDGDLDLIINRLNEEALVLENSVSSSRIMVRLVGESPNTQAIGSKVKLQGGPGGPAPQQKEITAGGEYLSGSESVAVFAADDESSNHIITITWPDGQQSRIDSVKANRFYEIEESEVEKKVVKDSSSSVTIFEDVSASIDHRHDEDSYNDFQVQPLLPYKLSRFGPGISWIDFDADGDDDLFIAAGQDGTTGAFENIGNGNFQEIQRPSKLQQSPGDQTTILGWEGAQGIQFLVGSANYGQGKMNPPSAYRYVIDGNRFTEQDSLPGIFPSTGSLAAADYDGDSDLDVFVGGRFVPAHYPEDASSRLFKNENGKYELDDRNSEILNEIGLVTSAVFSDYDGDGDMDLILSREWDSIVLLENDNGNFRDVSSQLGLDSYKGWWQGMATGDFNNDGRPDIIATNMGLNTPYQLDVDQPLKMHYWDFGQDNRIDIIEARYNTAVNGYVPIRQLQEFESIPSVMYKNIRNHEEFAKASLNQLLGFSAEDRLAAKEINTLSHHLFINTENGFVAHPLPDVAQLSPAFSANVADFNNDGNEDVFLSQNFFQVRPRAPRMDGGRGLWLKGDGEGNFSIVPGHISGIKVYGEQRGAALADFNGDAKVDLAVSQNDGATKLFENRTPNPGLRIQLEGLENNRDGIGSSIRLIYEDGSKGPRRELQAGSGYWSQNSTTQIMGFTGTPAQIEVTWYDGRISTVDVNENTSTYLISYPASN